MGAFLEQSNFHINESCPQNFIQNFGITVLQVKPKFTPKSYNQILNKERKVF